MPSLEERARYQSDSGVMAARLPILIVVPLVAAAGLAWVLKFAYIHDWYWVIVLPGLALANQLYLAVQAQGYGRKGTHALMLALEHISNIKR